MATNDYDLTGAVQYHTGAFPPAELDYQAILPALNDAAASLAHYDAKMAGMVNSNLLLAPLQRQDAVSSSRMENTISTITDVYRLEAESQAATPKAFEEARDDDIETFLYSLALSRTRTALDDGQPFSEHLIKSAHHALLATGRGSQKNPGAYKTAQNYIGDDRTRKIQYIPISPEQLPPAMERLLQFIADGSTLPLLRTALAHVEFEALHPFDDGNGRIGRMLITLMLWQTGVLSQPNFFVSGYFEDHKPEYIARMRAVSGNSDWSGWVVFFLNALHRQAQRNIEIADQIAALYAQQREQFRELLNSQYHDQALDYLFLSPVFRNDSFVEKSGIPATTARGIVRKLTASGDLHAIEPAAGRRAALYSYRALLDLLQV